VSAVGLLVLGAYAAIDPPDAVAKQPPFAAVLTADACLGSEGRAKDTTVLLKFTHSGRIIVGKVPNYGFIEPATVGTALLALRAGDSVLLNTREPIEDLDTVEIVFVSRAAVPVMTADHAISARKAADLRMLHILLGAMTIGVLCVVGYRIACGSWREAP
jgi:hypothetical protein